MVMFGLPFALSARPFPSPLRTEQALHVLVDVDPTRMQCGRHECKRAPTIAAAKIEMLKKRDPGGRAQPTSECPSRLVDSIAHRIVPTLHDFISNLKRRPHSFQVTGSDRLLRVARQRAHLQGVE